MKTSVRVALPASSERVFDYLCDLISYAELIPLVHSVVGSMSEGERVWDVELRAKVGPFARSKKLRMKRTVCDPHSNIVFVRDENDTREHAEWTLAVDVSPRNNGCAVEIKLAYGGRLWTAGVMERVLHDNIEEGTRRLTAKFS